MYSKEEAKNLKLEFWNSFHKYCRQHKQLKHKRTPFILHKTGINHIELKFDVDRSHVRVVLEINHKNQDRRLDVYEYVEAFKIMLTEGLQNVIWNFAFIRENGQEVGRAYVETTEYDFYNKEHWNCIYDYMCINMILLESNFLEIRDTLKDQLRRMN